VIEQINSLGENAKRMLSIGIVQDELVKLGFNFALVSCNINELIKYLQHKESEMQAIIVVFRRDVVALDFFGNHSIARTYDYSSSTWQQDLINKVKELINE